MPATVEQKSGYKVVTRRGLGDDAATPQVKSSWGLYPTPRYAGPDNYRPRPFIGQTTAKGGLSSYDRWEILNYSQQLFTQLGNLGSAVLQKNSWSVGDGWDPQYTGTNTSWAEDVSAWLREQWYPMCNTRGEPFDFKTTLYLSGVAWDVDGDDLMVLTETDTGFPQISIIPSRRIGGQRQADGEVKGGAFDGAKLYDGVIFNRDGRAIGYRITNEDGEGYQDLSSFNAQLMFDPEWSDQARGIPLVARSILDWFDVQDIDTFLKRGVKLDSSQGIVHYNELGEATDASDTVAASEMTIGGALSGDTRKDEVIPSRDLQMKPIAGGEYTYMRANSGEKIESFKSDRPHPNTEAFIQRLERRGLLAIGWFYDLLDLTSISGAPSRLLKDLAMQTIQKKQKYLKRRGLRALKYAIGKGMKTGKIPHYYPDGRLAGDAFMWDFEMPGEISIDTGNDEAADRENMKMGTTNLSIICAKKGLGSFFKLTKQTQREILNWDKLAQEVVTATDGRITYEKAMEMFTQRTPNGTPMNQFQDPPEPPAPPKKGAKP